MGVASPLPFSSCCDLAKEESLFTMSSSEGFLLLFFFFFFGDIFIEMDEWKNQFEYILCNTYYRIHFTIHMLQCMLYDIFYTIQYLNNIYSIKYTMYCSVCIIWYKFYHFVCLFRYILYDIFIYLVCFALLVSYSLYCLVCVVLCAL